MIKSELRKYFEYLSDGTFRRIKRVHNHMPGVVVKGTVHHKGYKNFRFKSKTETFHRAIYIWHHGKIKGEVDHINGVRTDNRIENLRDVTRTQNHCNLTKTPKNKTGIKGLYRPKRGTSKWVGSVQLNRRVYTVASKNKKVTIERLRKLREQLHGEFARHK